MTKKTHLNYDEQMECRKAQIYINLMNILYNGKFIRVGNQSAVLKLGNEFMIKSIVKQDTTYTRKLGSCDIQHDNKSKTTPQLFLFFS